MVSRANVVTLAMPMSESLEPTSPHPYSSANTASLHFPWALLIAVLLVIGFELWVRTWPADRRVAYRDDDDQVTAVRQQIEVAAAPDVAFVGSSQTYQGIATPELEHSLTEQIGHAVTVRNFAIRGGRVDLFEATIRSLLRQPTKPKLIVVGISMRDVRESSIDADRLSQFWTLADWRHESKHQWLGDQLPQVIRNEAGRVWWTLRDRSAVATRLEQWFIVTPSEPMPARGERPSQHLGGKRIQSLANDLDDFKRPTSKRRMAQVYRPELPAKPPAILADRVTEIIDDCHRASVKLIFVDMPLSKPLRDLIENYQHKTRERDSSKDFDPAYHELMSKDAQRGGVPFVSSADLKLSWTNDDFFDGQHLNFAGAVKLSRALSPVITEQLTQP